MGSDIRGITVPDAAWSFFHFGPQRRHTCTTYLYESPKEETTPSSEARLARVAASRAFGERVASPSAHERTHCQHMQSELEKRASNLLGGVVCWLATWWHVSDGNNHLLDAAARWVGMRR